MLMIYGRLMPLRILEEIRFWKMQEKEHTVVIRSLVPQLEPPFVRLMNEWEQVFGQTEESANALITSALGSAPSYIPTSETKLQQLMQVSMMQSQEFIKQLYQMMEHSRAIRSLPIARTVIIHIIRESEYFLNVIHAYMHAEPSPYRENYRSQHGSTEPSASAHSYVERFEDTIQSQQATATNEGLWSSAYQKEGQVPIGKHTLPPLPYAYNALEPYIDEKTMRLHHDEHHQSYVNGLNQAEKKMMEARRSGNFDLIKHWEREAAFNGAGHYLHTLFWETMSPEGGGKPEGAIAEQIRNDFGSFDAFKKHFSQAAEKVEGGGWAILVWSPRSRRMEILQAEKHQNLSQWDIIPLLPLDVWEHAYYLKYPNKRAKYIEAWWNVVHWPSVNERFRKARELKWQPF
ncbi:Fe-Mn family superoxide dismutase [Marinicrinis lubricantis]|uniref:superoxide dismutase n=1 Tax=Marinicrinis lubricantis TaxID=2086470 RepID=A0ABW1IS44_9BACL